MEQSEVQELFIRFTTPLAGFAALGGRKETVEELARNLWMVMLAGEQVKQEVWRSISAADTELCETGTRCYIREMKSSASDEELAALRRRY